MRGSLWLMGGKTWFVISAFLLYSGLSRILTPEEFGSYSLIVNLVSIFNMVLITTTLQSVSKFTALQDPEKVKRQALCFLVLLGGVLAAASFFSAPAVARLLKDPPMAMPLRFAAFIMFFYGIYAVFIGSLNGLKKFTQQALFDGSYSTVRLVCILGLAHFTGTVQGAVWGFLLASVLIVAAAAGIVGTGKPGKAFEWREFLGFSVFLIGFYMLSNAMTSADLFMLKSAGHTAEGPGYYSAALTIARIPYMVLTALNLAVFPMVSGHASRPSDETARLVEKGFLGCLLLALVPALLVAADAGGTLRLIYPPAYLSGANALRILAFAYLFFCLFTYTATVLNAASDPKLPFLTALAALIFEAAAAYYLVPHYGLEGAAFAALISFAAGWIVNSVFLISRRLFSVHAAVLLKVAAISAALFFLSAHFPCAKLMLLTKDAALAVLYGILLVLTGVIRMNELPFLSKGKTVRAGN